MSDSKDNNLLITNVRLSYAFLYSPYKGEDGSQSYCTHLIFERNHPQLPAINQAIRRAAATVWKDQAEVQLKALKAQQRLCVKEGDVAKPGIEAYAGKLFMSSSSKVRPRIVATISGINQEVDQDHEFAPYSGCIANVMVNVWAQSNKYGKRINAQLMGVQFVRHEERLSGGGRVASVNEFAIIASDADSAEPAGEGLL